MEFRPLIPEIGFRPPTDDDPRARKPKADEADFAEKLKAHDAFPHGKGRVYGAGLCARGFLPLVHSDH